MKKTILIYIFTLFCISANAQVDSLSILNDSPTLQDTILTIPAIMDDLQYATIIQDSAITVMMQYKIANLVQGQQEGKGWRVQIYSSNASLSAKSDAIALEKEISPHISMPVYVLYTPPFWKVRIGNFRTQEEAIKYKNEFVQQFPDMLSKTYVVRDEHILLMP